MTGRYPDRAGVPGVIRTHPENSWGLLSTGRSHTSRNPETEGL